MAYLNKYKMNKKMYDIIKYNMEAGGKKYDYYILHGTDLPNLESILNDGYIFSNIYLPHEKKRLSGWESLSYVYCNIYFDKLKNLPHNFGYSVILHPKIIENEGIIFNKGWLVHPTEDSIFIEPHDPKIKIKINEIKKIIKNPTKLAETMINLPSMMQHEVLIKDKIDLHKYLLGIIVVNLDISLIEKIKNIIKIKKYKNVKFITDGKLPSFKELIKMIAL